MPITLLNEQSTKLPSKYVSPYLQIGVALSPHQRNFFVWQMVDVYIASQLVKGQRTQVCDFLSHKWHIYCNKFPSPRLRKPNREPNNGKSGRVVKPRANCFVGKIGLLHLWTHSNCGCLHHTSRKSSQSTFHRPWRREGTLPLTP